MTFQLQVIQDRTIQNQIAMISFPVMSDHLEKGFYCGKKKCCKKYKKSEKKRCGSCPGRKN